MVGHLDLRVGGRGRFDRCGDLDGLGSAGTPLGVGQPLLGGFKLALRRAPAGSDVAAALQRARCAAGQVLGHLSEIVPVGPAETERPRHRQGGRL